MNRQFAVIGAGLALALAATTAQAAVVISSVKLNAQMGAAFNPTSLVTFNQFKAGTPADFTTGGITFVSSPLTTGAFIEKGSVTNAYTAPAGDTTNFLALGNSNKFATRSESLAFAAPTSKFGFYWGSIDKYNTVQFFSGTTLVGTLNGSNVVSSSAGQMAFRTSGVGNGVNTDASAYVSFLDQGGSFNRVVLTTTQPNFEIDNVAVGGVPEASTWAMMLIGFGGLGGLMLQRRKTSRANSAMVAA